MSNRWTFIGTLLLFRYYHIDSQFNMRSVLVYTTPSLGTRFGRGCVFYAPKLQRIARKQITYQNGIFLGVRRKSVLIHVMYLVAVCASRGKVRIQQISHILYDILKEERDSYRNSSWIWKNLLLFLVYSKICQIDVFSINGSFFRTGILHIGFYVLNLHALQVAAWCIRLSKKSCSQVDVLNLHVLQVAA